MEGFSHFTNALEYIENHLDDKIDYTKAAQIACCSEYHLSRMFSALVGVSLSEYVRRRRLTMAALELQNTDIRVLDVAVKYGYESADSFSRAFHRMHGISPTGARDKGAKLIAYPKLSFHITVKGEASIVYRMEEVEEDIYILGKVKQVASDRAPIEVPAIWQQALKDGYLDELINLSEGFAGQKLGGMLGVYGKGADNQEEYFDYLLGVRTEKTSSDEMTIIKIEKGTWLVFTELEEAVKRLFSEWIPTLGYELEDKPFIECVYEPGHIPEVELWVPIKV